MSRTVTFAKRNLIEISRDTLSYIFCIGFPAIMMIVMTLINESIPKEAGMTIFRIDNLSGGIAIFGQMFVMLFTALTVSKDRSTSFLVRLFASPMKSSDFTNGYLLPMVLISFVQGVMSFVLAIVISLLVGFKLQVLGLLAGLVILLPSAVMFSSIGLIFGTILGEKSAPGMCSIIISLGSFFGAIWFDAESTGGVLYKICRCLPFIYCTKSVRAAIRLDFGMESFVVPLLIVTGCALVLAVLASVLFKTKMKADLS